MKYEQYLTSDDLFILLYTTFPSHCVNLLASTLTNPSLNYISVL